MRCFLAFLPLMTSLAMTPEEEFRKEYPRYGRMYADYFREYRAKYLVTATELDVIPNVEEKFRVECLVNADNSRGSRTLIPPRRLEDRPHAERIAVAGPGRSFLLERAKVGSPLVVRYFQKGNDPEINSYIQNIQAGIESPFRVQIWPVQEILTSSRSEVGEVQSIGKGMDRRIKVSFQYRWPEARKGLTTGWFTLSPEKAWRIEEYETRSLGGRIFLRTETVYDEQPTPEGLWLPRKIRWSSGMVQGPGPHTEEWILEEFHKGPSPAARFSLADFGLEALEHPNRPSIWASFTPWFFGLALLTLILSVVLKKSADRLASRFVS